MHLISLEIQGFKTFQKKTRLDFGGSRKTNLTVIVGPNGSGKSNIADAIRWCLGEQSMKQLRGKKTEDIIFSGSEGKAQAGFAEVSMTLDNTDRAMNVDYTEVVITRRVYRDGDASYLLNGKQVRLTDIQLLLAEAGIGQRTYAVIGQGMIDHVLTSSPEERKVFFDDATGVRGLQMKRHQAALKLKRSSEHLQEARMILREIEPRLSNLRRQVSRLEKRERVENDLRALERSYYNTVFWQLEDERTALQRKRKDAAEAVRLKRTELQKGDDELAAIEAEMQEENDDSKAIEAEKAYRAAQARLRAARDKKFEAERAIEIAKVRSQSSWAPLPLHAIIEEIDAITQEHDQLHATITSGGDITAISRHSESVLKKAKALKQRLIKPQPQDFTASAEQLTAIKEAEAEIEAAEHGVEEIERKLHEVRTSSKTSKSAILETQRALRRLQNDIHTLEGHVHAIDLDLARTETSLSNVKQEMREWLPADLANQLQSKKQIDTTDNPERDRDQMRRLRRELELIGGIDDGVMEEFHELEARHSYLSGQVNDLESAMLGSEKLIHGLDKDISTQNKTAFAAINKAFGMYFKLLFGGGDAALIQLRGSQNDETKVTLDRALEALAEDHLQEEADILARFEKTADFIRGIDIHATPPGKRLKSLNLLSGGERALTSIALLSAILETNPAPFVVLDEVDAALDESNTLKFAEILGKLQPLTQFIVITHNRATMEAGDKLYGVTMDGNGISNLLSVELKDFEENLTARR